MDAPSLQTHSPQTQDGRIPLSADASILPPAYRSAIANEWAYRYPQYYSEWEDIYWLFDGWDELADRLYVDWAAHLSEVEAVRRAYAKFDAGDVRFPSLAAKTAHLKQLDQRDDRMHERAGELSRRFAGPAGLCLLRRRYLARNPELDRTARLTDLPSLNGPSLLSSALDAGKTAASSLYSWIRGTRPAASCPPSEPEPPSSPQTS
ncbi:hypothetical protein NBRC10512_003698 [Rhodotorula toruloides]